MNILLCFGTRPEAIKMAPISHEMIRRGLSHKICVTGQHREMLDQVIEFFDVKVDYDLDLMRQNQSLNELSSGILLGLNGIFSKEKFDLILVHGDTTTSTMAAIAGFYSGIKIAHVEAGLRTYKKFSPYPEEINRQLTDKIADYYFAPTQIAAQNLLNEGVKTKNIIITGNTVTDALEYAILKLNNGFVNSEIKLLREIIVDSKKLILITGHRRESFGEGFKNLCKAIIELAKLPDVQILYPVHLNPNVQDVVYDMLSGNKNIHLINPLGYPAFVWLMKKSSIIISDSGGIQEEAPTLSVPVLVTRKTTERSEGIHAGVSYLVGTKTKTILKKARELLFGFEPQVQMENPYGDGKAAIKIVTFIEGLELKNRGDKI